MAKDDQVEGLDLLWRFVKLADSIFERCDDNSGMPKARSGVKTLGKCPETFVALRRHLFCQSVRFHLRRDMHVNGGGIMYQRCGAKMYHGLSGSLSA